MSPYPGIRPQRGDRGAQGMTQTKQLTTTSIFAATTISVRSSSGFDLPLRMQGPLISSLISSNRIYTRRCSAPLGGMTRLMWTCRMAFLGIRLAGLDSRASRLLPTWWSCCR